MANELELGVIIRAHDEATQNLLKVNAAIEKSREAIAKLGGKVEQVAPPMARFGVSISEASNAVGLFSPRLGFAAQGLTQFASAAAKLGPAAISIGAVAGAGAGLVALGISAAKADEQLRNMSQRTGVTVETLSGLRLAAITAETSLEDVAQGFKFLGRTMSEAAKGLGEEAGLFKSLGVDVKDSSGHLRAMDKVLLNLADRFAGSADDARKVAVALAIFGRSGEALIPFLNQGSAGIRELIAEAERLGLIVSTKAAKAADELGDAWEKLKLTATGLGHAVGREMNPVLAGAVGLMQSALETAKGLVERFERFRGSVRDLGVTLGLREPPDAAALHRAGERAGFELVKPSITKDSAAEQAARLGIAQARAVADIGRTTGAAAIAQAQTEAEQRRLTLGEFAAARERLETDARRIETTREVVQRQVAQVQAASLIPEPTRVTALIQLRAQLQALEDDAEKVRIALSNLLPEAAARRQREDLKALEDALREANEIPGQMIEEQRRFFQELNMTPSGFAGQATTRGGAPTIIPFGQPARITELERLERLREELLLRGQLVGHVEAFGKVSSEAFLTELQFLDQDIAKLKARGDTGLEALENLRSGEQRLVIERERIGIRGQIGQAELARGLIGAGVGGREAIGLRQVELDLDIRRRQAAEDQNKDRRELNVGLAEAEAMTRRLQIQFDATARVDPMLGLRLGLRDTIDEFSSFGDMMRQGVNGLAHDMSRAFSDNFFNIMTGQFKKLSDLPKALATSTLRAVADILGKIQTGFIARQIGSLFPGLGLQAAVPGAFLGGGLPGVAGLAGSSAAGAPSTPGGVFGPGASLAALGASGGGMSPLQGLLATPLFFRIDPSNLFNSRIIFGFGPQAVTSGGQFIHSGSELASMGLVASGVAGRTAPFTLGQGLDLISNLPFAQIFGAAFLASTIITAARADPTARNRAMAAISGGFSGAALGFMLGGPPGALIGATLGSAGGGFAQEIGKLPNAVKFLLFGGFGLLIKGPNINEQRQPVAAKMLQSIQDAVRRGPDVAAIVASSASNGNTVGGLMLIMANRIIAGGFDPPLAGGVPPELGRLVAILVEAGVVAEPFRGVRPIDHLEELILTPGVDDTGKPISVQVLLEALATLEGIHEREAHIPVGFETTGIVAGIGEVTTRTIFPSTRAAELGAGRPLAVSRQMIEDILSDPNAIERFIQRLKEVSANRAITFVPAPAFSGGVSP